MASAYKVPYKKKLQTESLKNKLSKNSKFTLPQKRKMLSNISENETIDQYNAIGTSEILPTRLRKSKRLDAKETNNTTITEIKNAEAFEETSNDTESGKSIADGEKLTEKNFQEISMVQDNAADMKEQITNDIIELKVDQDMNELNKINNLIENSSLLPDTISNVYQEELLESKSMVQTDQAATNTLSSHSGSTDSYESNLTAKSDLQDNVSNKILNIDSSQKVNMSENINTSIQELKILKIVLEDTYVLEKQRNDTGESLHKENGHDGEDIKGLKNIQEENGICKYEKNINSHEIEKDFESKDTWINKVNILNSLGVYEKSKENLKILANDKENQLNESYCSSDAGNKTLTVYLNENSTNTLDNSSMSDNSFDEEKCCLTLNTILNNKPDQNIDFPKLENKPTYINEQEIQVNCSKKSPKFLSSRLKSTKKILTIPCMSALDYEKECGEKDSFEAKNNSHHAEDVYHEPNTSQILKDSANENFSAMQNVEDMKIQDADLKQICKQIPHSSIQIMPKENNLHLEGNLFKRENSEPSENSYNFNEIIQKDETKVLKDTIPTLHAENVNLNQPTNKTDCNIFSKDKFLSESIIFREKAETDDSDVIPTGVFKHLNEMYEYNKITTSMLVKDSASTKPSSMEEISNENREETGTSNLKTRMAWLEEESSFLVTAADCIKSIKNPESSDIKDKDEECIQDKEKMKEDAINKEAPCTSEQPKNEINKTIRKLINEIPIGQVSPLEEPDFSDIENCMEMDDDFDLTASQLRMLDADEKIQSQPINKTTTSQQTDICGYTYFGNDAVTFEIINQLQYLRESVEYIRNKLETSTSDENAL